MLLPLLSRPALTLQLQLTTMRRFEWLAVKRRLGRPRRFSNAFVAQQRELLHQQREAALGGLAPLARSYAMLTPCAAALAAGRTGPNPLVEVAPGQFCVGDRVVGTLSRRPPLFFKLLTVCCVFAARHPSSKGLLSPGVVVAVLPQQGCYRGKNQSAISPLASLAALLKCACSGF